MAGNTARKMYTLTEVSKKTGISMPTLQRYKKSYQERIPSEGSGRTQRYPQEALDVFNELKTENLKRRGRPRKNAAASAPAAAPKAAAKAPKKAAAKKQAAKKAVAKKPAAKKAAPSAPKKAEGDLITLTEIGKRTGISYPTLLRYVRSDLKRIPHVGSGRSRRFRPEAVDVFAAIRDENAKRRGRTKGAAAAKAPAKGKAAPKAAATKKASAAATKKKGPKRSAGTAAAPAAAPADAALTARIVALEKANKALVRDVTRLQKAVARPFRVTLKR